MNCKKRKAPSVCALSARELTAKTVPPQTEELFTPSAAGIGTKAMLPFKPGSAASAVERLSLRQKATAISPAAIAAAQSSTPYGAE